jgi:hypothetical protein
MFGSADDFNLGRIKGLEDACDYYRKENTRLKNALAETHKLLKETQNQLATYTALDFDYETVELVVFKKKCKGE